MKRLRGRTHGRCCDPPGIPLSRLRCSGLWAAHAAPAFQSARKIPKRSRIDPARYPRNIRQSSKRPCVRLHREGCSLASRPARGPRPARSAVLSLSTVELRHRQLRGSRCGSTAHSRDDNARRIDEGGQTEVAVCICSLPQGPRVDPHPGRRMELGNMGC